MRWEFDSADVAGAKRARSEFVASLHDGCGVGADLADAQIIFDELVGNVVRHAPGPVRIQLDCQETHADLTVENFGAPFTLESRPQPDGDEESGRGLWIVRSLASNLEVHHADGWTTVSVRLPVERHANEHAAPGSS
ncbi:MAG TPA: ATP-binding protein [Candidatus Baltobacteraceae bacterium]